MKNFLIFLFLIISCLGAFSQDLIITKKGDKITCKVLSVEQNSVSYKKSSNLDGPSYSIEKTQIASVTYKNGDVDVFTEEATEENNKTGQTTENVESNDSYNKRKSSRSFRSSKSVDADCSIFLSDFRYMDGRYYDKYGNKLGNSEMKMVMEHCDPRMASKFGSGCGLKAAGKSLTFTSIGVMSLGCIAASESTDLGVALICAGSICFNVGLPLWIAGGVIRKNNIRRFYSTYMQESASIENVDEPPLLLHFGASPKGIGISLSF